MIAATKSCANNRTDLTRNRQKRRFRNSYDFRPRFRAGMIYGPTGW